MNAGLSNLATLKAWLLPAGLRSGTDYNAAITSIGLGVAAQLENFCNRTFARAVAATFECEADRTHVGVPRFPIEAVTRVEVRANLTAGFVDQGAIATVIENISEAAGLVFLASRLGTRRDRLRITYTGGFWWNQQEPDYVPPVTPTDIDPNLSLQPAGAIALPADLQEAWLLQCEQVWKVKDRLGLVIGEEGGGSGALLGLSLPGLDINPFVMRGLQPFVRYSLT